MGIPWTFSITNAKRANDGQETIDVELWDEVRGFGPLRAAPLATRNTAYRPYLASKVTASLLLRLLSHDADCTRLMFAFALASRRIRSAPFTAARILSRRGYALQVPPGLAEGEKTIWQKLEDRFSPETLQVQDVSGMPVLLPALKCSRY